MSNNCIRKWKDSVAIAESLFTIGAIIVGGFWTYHLFIQQRQSDPRLEITQKISHVRLSDQNKMLVVDETLKNTGTVQLRIRKGGIRIVQVLPLPPIAQKKIQDRSSVLDSDKNKNGDIWNILQERQLTWPDGDLVIEPGESDELHNEFILQSNIDAVTVVSYIYNPQAENLAWRVIEMHDFRVSGFARNTDSRRTAPKTSPSKTRGQRQE